MKNAVIYTRNANHNAQATNAQLEICRKYADEHGYNVVAEFSDDSYLGLNFDRSGFNAMNNIRDQWDTLLIYSVDVLSRNVSDILKYRKLLCDECKKIVLTAEPHSSDMCSVLDSLQELYPVHKKGVPNK